MAKCDRRGIFSCVFVLVLSMANAVLAESVTVHVPEGDVTLDEALRELSTAFLVQKQKLFDEKAEQ